MADVQTRDIGPAVKTEPPEMLNMSDGVPSVEAVRMVPKKKKTQADLPHAAGALPGRHERAARKRLSDYIEDPRFQHELKEMQETHDLDDIDDDVEVAATLFEWRAEEHIHRPKSSTWFVALAVGTTLVVGAQLFFFANFIGAITIGFISVMIYFIAQRKPEVARYRLMIDGIAVNNTLWHYRDLEVFNVLYEPEDECKTVIFRSKRRFSPYIHMEIGDADPVEIRDILIERLEEDQELDEPWIDVLARRLGF